MAHWTSPHYGLEVFGLEAFNPNVSKIACFDMDGTLITTRSGKKFPKGADDWKWLTPDVLSTLNKVNETHSIVIITNQSKFNDEIRKKIETIIQATGLSILALVSTDYTKYRKPMIGMWEYLNSICPTIDKSSSYYVGDAMDNKYDHSNCDLLWAANAGITFHYAPVFWGQNTKRVVPKPTLPSFEIVGKKGASLTDIHCFDVVILVGPPAIGKSKLANEIGYNVVSKDSVKSGYKTFLTKTIKNHTKCVIDNTNPDIKSRNETMDLVKKYWTEAKCCIVRVHPTDNQREIANYFNHFRCYQTNRWIPSIVYNIFYKRLEFDDNLPILCWYNTYDTKELTHYY